MTNRELQYLKDTYPPGIRIRLISMDREPQMPPGMMGIVTFVDDIGQIHTQWENGSSLALSREVDKFIAFSGPTAGEYLRERYGPDDKIWFREVSKPYRVVVIDVGRLIAEAEKYAGKNVSITSELAAAMAKPYKTVSIFDAFLSDHVLTEERAREIKEQREYSSAESEQWQCPKCGHNTLSYGQTKLDESYVTCPWACKTCLPGDDYINVYAYITPITGEVRVTYVICHTDGVVDDERPFDALTPGEKALIWELVNETSLKETGMSIDANWLSLRPDSEPPSTGAGTVVS